MSSVKKFNKNCAICGTTIEPYLYQIVQELIDLHVDETPPGTPQSTYTSGTDSPRTPLLNQSLQQQTNIKVGWLPWLLHYLKDCLCPTAVYFHQAGEAFSEAATTKIYYCNHCGPRVGAHYVNYGFYADGVYQFALNQSPLHMKSFYAYHLATPQLTPGRFAGYQSHYPGLRNRTSPQRPPRGRALHESGTPIPFDLDQSLVQSPKPSPIRIPNARSMPTPEDDIDSTLSNPRRTPLKKIAQAIVNDDNVKQYYFSNKSSGVFHNLLKLLSPAYNALAEQAVRSNHSMLIQFTKEQAWGSYLGLTTDPRLSEIVQEVKESITALDDHPEIKEKLYIHNPAFWSMKHITEKSVMQIMEHHEKPWWNPLAISQQKLRLIVALIIVIFIILLITYPEWFAAPASKHGHTTAPTPHPTTPPPSPPPHPGPTPPSPHPSPPPSPPPTGPDCNISSACESTTNWDLLSSVFEYNYNLTNPITTIGDLSNACTGVINVFAVLETICDHCTPGFECRQLLGDPRTDTLIFCETLRELAPPPATTRATRIRRNLKKGKKKKGNPYKHR